MRFRIAFISALLVAGVVAQEQHPFLGRWISIDSRVFLDFELDPRREDEGSFLKTIEEGSNGTQGIWELVGDSLETFSHDKAPLGSPEILFVEDPVMQRYAIEVQDDTMRIRDAGGTWLFVPRLRCDNLRVVAINGTAAGISVRLRPRDSAVELSARLAEAVDLGATTTGIQAFDSVGLRFSLQHISNAARPTGSFELLFPPEVDMESIAREYCGIPDLFESVLAHPLPATTILPMSWGRLKSDYDRSSSED